MFLRMLLASWLRDTVLNEFQRQTAKQPAQQAKAGTASTTDSPQGVHQADQQTPPGDQTTASQGSRDTHPEHPSRGATLRESECQIGLVFALGVEAGGTLDQLEHRQELSGAGFRVHLGTLAGVPVAVIQGGPGRAAAAQATEWLIDGHRPRWVISAGFAGGLIDELAHAHFLLANEAVDPAGTRFSIDVHLSQQQRAAHPELHVGRLLTVDQVVTTEATKRQLAAEHHAVAVDMETVAVAEVCSRRHTRLLSVRIISDAVTDELPPGIGKLLKQRTTAGKLGAALANVFSSPSRLRDLWKLREKALLDAEKLGQFLASVVPALAEAS